MKSSFCLVFVVLYLTAILIFTIYLRNAENHIFYKLCTIKSRHNRLKQELWQKQLHLESLINPAAILQHIGSERKK